MLKPLDARGVLIDVMLRSGRITAREADILRECPAKPAPNDVNASLSALVQSLASQTEAIGALVKAISEEPARDEAQDTIPGMEVEYLNPPRAR